MWFVHNITLDGSTLKDYVSLPAPRDGEKIPATVPRCFLVGESLAVRVEWKGPSGQRQVRVVPMANVICFEPVSDATD